MVEKNQNTRLEAFCDGVFAIAMTLLVMDVKIPESILISTNTDFWHALKEILPTVMAFVLSFIIILITWVNHHNTLKLVTKSSPSFIYANGLLLLSVVFLPFPTGLLGTHILSEHAAPAVILYNLTIVVQSIAWILISSSAVSGNLYVSEQARKILLKNKTFGLISCIIYSTFSIMAFWFPLFVAMVTVLLWIFWLVYGIRIKHENSDS